MITRLKKGKVVDTIIFNQEKDYGEKESDDILAKKQVTQKVKIFGLQQQEIQVYQYHKYYTTYFLSKTVGTNLIRQFISGYFGISEDNIQDYNESELDPINQQNIQISFEIQEEQYSLLTMIERQQKLGDYKQLSEQIKLYAPIYKAFNIKTKQRTLYFKNTINESQYIDIFNQLYIGKYEMKVAEYFRLREQHRQQQYAQNQIQFHVVCVKYNNNYKGKIYYPMKYYHDLPITENNSLLIQMIDINQLTTYIFKQEKIIVILQLITTNVPNPFKFKLLQPTKIIMTYQVQLNFVNQTQKQITKKMDLLNFMPQWRKTHGNQFLITGIKHKSQYYPNIKITFFPSTNYVQIQCETDDIDTANFNFTMLMNYFQLEDQFKEFYEDNGGKVKKDQVNQYIEHKNSVQNNITRKTQFDLSGIGTSKFNVKQQFFTNQDSQLDDLQLVDPISYGIDDRYEYQKLVTDVQKRPIQIQTGLNYIDVMQEFSKQRKQRMKDEEKDNESDDKEKEEKKEKEKKEYNIKGGAKGSPVYINKQNTYSKFLLYQQNLVVNGFYLRNQTYIDLYNRFRCSQNYPYLLLGNTKGKDSISCVIEPMNQDGLSIFEFYDVGVRLLHDNHGFLTYLRALLYGRVSISATKFSQWITPGRCSEMPLNLKKLLGSNLLLLSMLGEKDFQASDLQSSMKSPMDVLWALSVFGQDFYDMYDGDIIYDYQDGQSYLKGINSKRPSFWVKFPNHKKYLVIEDEIITKVKDGKKYHYYKPYFPQLKFSKQKRNFDLDYYKDFGILGFIHFPFHNHNYLVTKKGTFPYLDTTYGLNLINQQITENLPTYEMVKKMINDTDNYIINYKGKIIGTQYNDLQFYWKETQFETKQKLTIGTYLISQTWYAFNKQTGFSGKDYILKGENEIEFIKDALANKQKIIEIIKYLDRLSEDPESNDSYYLFRYVPLLYKISEKEIDIGLRQLMIQLPKTDQLMYDYIKGLYRFSNNKDLIYDPSRREEILKLNIKKDHDYE